jgi:hypothetical protein
MGAYIFPADAKSPPSTVGGFGMFSTNGSWAFGGISKLNLAEDHYRVTAFLMLGHINWDFYGIGNEAADRGLFVPNLAADGWRTAGDAASSASRRASTSARAGR